MKRKITLLLAFFPLLLNAQSYVNRVIILNEGHYDYVNMVQTVPVTVGAYNPVTHQYAAFDTILNARFASHVLVDGSSIYVAADSFLIRYDADTYQRLATATVTGIRKLAVWNNQLLVSRGEYMVTFNSYFRAYDKSTLAFSYELTTASGPQFASENIVVKNNIGYVAINNGFDFGNEVGLIGRIDLQLQQYMNEINLGTTGKNPENMILDGNTLYTVNNRDYTTASISNVDVVSQAVNTTNLNTSTGCGASGYTPGYVMFQVMGDNRIARFSVSTLSMHDTLLINRSIYGMATDPVNNLIYIGETDYLSSGNIFIYNLAGALLDSFAVSVSPGTMDFDIRSTAGIKSAEELTTFSAFPNPFNGLITISSSQRGEKVFVITDVAGRVIKRIVTDEYNVTIDLAGCDAGVYILQQEEHAGKMKIVKQ